MLHPHSFAFAAIFEGFTQAHGIYNIKKKEGTGKVKGQAASIVGDVTVDLWSKHLNGEQGLGIIPINEKNLCKFGAIDVDDYNLDPSSLHNRAKKLGLPFVVCRTKSGGSHLYLFTTDFIPAPMMKAKLEHFASLLGVGGSEIFPKQTQLLVDRGDAGSWINMPYFGGDKTDRFAFNQNGLPCKTVEQFLAMVQEKMVDPETLEHWTIPVKEPLGTDCPPCLNCLCSQGFPEGTRNDGLMNLGVLAMRKDKDKWPQILDEWNTSYMDPPLSSVEVLGVIKSQKKKEYHFMCNRQPLQSFCNKPLCRSRKYGIGEATGMPTMGTLTKFDSIPPIWFIDVEGKGRLELQTEDLQQPLRFQKCCMEQLDCVPPILKREDWSSIISALLETVNVVQIPLESTPRGLLMSHLEDFINSKSQHHVNRDKEVLLSGNVWLEDKYAYFRLKDFLDYLQIRRFTEFKPNKIAIILKDLNAEHVFINIKGKGVNVYKIISSLIIQRSPFNVPKQQESAI
jgi:hypothetical protein